MIVVIRGPPLDRFVGNRVCEGGYLYATAADQHVISSFPHSLNPDLLTTWSRWGVIHLLRSTAPCAPHVVERLSFVGVIYQLLFFACYSFDFLLAVQVRGMEDMLGVFFLYKSAICRFHAHPRNAYRSILFLDRELLVHPI